MTNSSDPDKSDIHDRTDARVRIPAEAAAIGVTPAFISTLVDRFYDNIRADAVLAPVFASRIAEDAWPRHLMNMKRFWASVVLNAGIYSGKPMAVHAKITLLEEDHFERWLALFDKTLNDIAPSRQAHDLLLAKANKIAESLRLGLFGYKFQD